MEAQAHKLVVDGHRLWRRLMSMAEVGKRGETGVDRAAFSPADRKARRLLCEWAREHRLEIWQDDIANLFLRYRGRIPSLAPALTGSHLDSQPTGGRFDGVFGVIAGLEVVASMQDAGLRPLRSIDVVAWSNEEGSRFPPGAMGSQVFSGAPMAPDFLDVRDADEVSLRQALAETLADLPEAPVLQLRGAPAAYLEAHVEQGPVLESAGVAVGVVTGIQGCLWLQYEIEGASAHAGTTPHAHRRDALEATQGLIADLRSLAVGRSAECRFTVGRMLVEPNTPNTVPGRVVFTVDFRDPDPLVFEEVRLKLQRTTASNEVACSARELFHHPPLRFPAAITKVVADAAREAHCPAIELVSGAFHDALFVSRRCPVGMIFVRSRRGISHNPEEFSDPADLAAGAQVLLGAIHALAEGQSIAD